MQGAAHGIKTCPFLPEANGIDYTFRLVMQLAIDGHADTSFSRCFNQLVVVPSLTQTHLRRDQTSQLRANMRRHAL